MVVPDAGEERTGVEQVNEGVHGEARTSKTFGEPPNTGVLDSKGVRGIAARSLMVFKDSRIGFIFGAEL